MTTIRKPTFPEMVHWVAMQTADELTEAEIERLLAVDEWIISQEGQVVTRG